MVRIREITETKKYERNIPDVRDSEKKNINTKRARYFLTRQGNEIEKEVILQRHHKINSRKMTKCFSREQGNKIEKKDLVHIGKDFTTIFASDILNY